MKHLFIALMFFVQTFASPLQELLALFEIPEERAIAETERLWLQRGKERWEYDARYEEMRPQVWPLFMQMGLFDEKTPACLRYDYALVLGALLNRVQDRIDHLKTLQEKGISFGQIVFLTGDRPLQNSERAITGLENESQMVRWVYERSDLPREIPVVFIDAPMNRNRRPQTADTITAWLQTNPIPGSCLAISNQPYIAYQNAVLKRLLPSGFSLETAGPAVQGSPTVALLLDTIAKELFWSAE